MLHKIVSLKMKTHFFLSLFTTQPTPSTQLSIVHEELSTQLTGVVGEHTGRPELSPPVQLVAKQVDD
jgi:hypothetical protein